MVQINFAQKEIQCKIVYYGPGMSGKTTNLELVHTKVPTEARGELTSIATTGERTLYFDYMPLDLGQIAGIRTKFQLYTVPGQIYYKSTRRLVLQGVDGIVFVADSSASKLKENKESLADLEENLREMGKSVEDVPIVIQYNKRDLPDAMPVADLEKEINPYGLPSFEAVAPRGEGVFQTLKDLAGRVLESVNRGGLAVPKPRPGTGRPVSTVAKAPPPAGAEATSAPAATSAPRTAARASPPLRPAAAASAHRPGGEATTAVADPPARAAAARSPTHVPLAAPVAAVAPARVPASSKAPARAATPASGAAPNLQDRLVKVRGLSRPSVFGKVPLVLLLGALIAGAVYFLLQQI